MANGDLCIKARHDWILANPWLWSLLGLGLCLLQWLVVLIAGESLSEIGAGFVFLGLLAVGSGLALRLNSHRPAYLDRLAAPWRQYVLLSLGGLFLLIFLATTGLLVLGFFESQLWDWHLRLSSLFLLWVFVGLVSLKAAMRCLSRLGPKTPITTQEETAALLALGALAAFCGHWALFNPADINDWDTIRLFLAVLVLVALACAGLVMISQALRRLVISVFVVLHFLGISTAVLSAPPSPWIVQQMWGRIYQPYLEFMYLNNAYHFYAPEPGPASYLWFRMFCEDPKRGEYAYWLKIPDVDEKGWHKYHLALEYQRMLAFTENTVPTDPTPNMLMSRPDGTVVYADWYLHRVEHSPSQLNMQQIVGKEQLNGLVIPYPSWVPLNQQYLQPNAASRALLSSYAKHICQAKHPEHPDWQVKYVKIYRVVHIIPDPTTFINDRLDPRDPANFRPYYMGKYDPEGRLLDINQYDSQGKLVKAGDPFLFWLLPMLRDPPENQLESPVTSWVAIHAGDPDCIYRYDPIEKRHLLPPDAR